MLGNLKEYIVLTGLMALLVSFPSTSRVTATETKLDKEIMISLSYGGPYDFYCLGSVAENFYMRELRASLELTHK